MFRKLAQIHADIQATVAAIEAEGNDERILMAAKFFEPLDLRYSANTYGLDKAPRIVAEINKFPKKGHYPNDNRRWHHGERGSLTHRLVELLREQDCAVEHGLLEELRPRTPRDRLIELLTEAEQSASNLEIDEIAFMLSPFVNPRWKDELTDNKPRLQAKLAEMPAGTNHHRALLTCSGRRNDDDLPGRAADLIIRWQQR